MSFDHQQIRFVALGARARAIGRGLIGALLLVGAVVLSLESAWAEEEVANFHFFGGGGFKRLALTTESSSARASFSGWGATGERGMRVPFSRKFGFGLAAVYARSDTMNSDGAGTFMESGYLRSIGASSRRLRTFAQIGIGFDADDRLAHD